MLRVTPEQIGLLWHGTPPGTQTHRPVSFRIQAPATWSHTWTPARGFGKNPTVLEQQPARYNMHRTRSGGRPSVVQKTVAGATTRLPHSYILMRYLSLA